MINEKEILEYVDSKICAILQRPRMYGTCKEAIELQIISHLEFKYVYLYGPNNVPSLLEIYQKHIQKLYPDTNTYLFVLIKDFDEFMKQLKYVTEQINNEIYYAKYTNTTKM